APPSVFTVESSCPIAKVREATWNAHDWVLPMQTRLKPAENAVVRAFHRLYYDGAEGKGRPFEDTQWMGVPCLKCPLDLWAYQEIVFETKPDLIIETGSYKGGSALFLAHLFDLMGNGHVVSIDIEHRERPQHPRITYFE